MFQAIFLVFTDEKLTLRRDLPKSHVYVRRRQWQPTPVLLPGKSRGRRSLVGCSPWGCEESDRTEWLHFHFSLSCIGEGNGDPLQYPCLENPRDGGAWWAAVYGVAQSRTQLTRLSSSMYTMLIKQLEFRLSQNPYTSHLPTQSEISCLPAN